MNSTVEDVSVKQKSQRPQDKFTFTKFLRAYGTQLGIILVFAVMWIFFIVAAPRTFLSPQIYLAFMSTIPFFAIMALPLTMVIIGGEMDLSFPSIMAIGMVAFITVFNSTGGEVALALVAGLLTGFLAGLLNGVLVVGIGVPSLVVTIGTQFFWRGAVLVLLGGQGHTLVGARDTLTYSLLVGKIGSIPMQMIWLVLIAVATWVLLNRHKFGAHIYVIGDNVQTAGLMGINTARTRMLAFALVGLASAFAGILASLQVSFFWPSLGEGYLLRTLAAVFLGGTSVFGGVGTILGTFIGSFIIGAIEAAIVAIGLTGFWTQLIYGLIIIVSVSMHAILRRRIG
jgi:simple sugar transport system permease protein